LARMVWILKVDVRSVADSKLPARLAVPPVLKRVSWALRIYAAAIFRDLPADWTVTVIHVWPPLFIVDQLVDPWVPVGGGHSVPKFPWNGTSRGPSQPGPDGRRQERRQVHLDSVRSRRYRANTAPPKCPRCLFCCLNRHPEATREPRFKSAASTISPPRRFCAG